MGWFALACASAAAVCVWLPGAALYGATALGVLGVGLGLSEYRRCHYPDLARLAGAFGIFVGTLALTLAAARYWLILATMDRLETLVQ